MHQYSDCMGFDGILARRQLELSLVGALFWCTLDFGKSMAAAIPGKNAWLAAASLRPAVHRFRLGDLRGDFGAVFSCLPQVHAGQWGNRGSEVTLLFNVRGRRTLHYGAGLYQAAWAVCRMVPEMVGGETNPLCDSKKSLFPIDSLSVNRFSRKRYV